jgi:molybdate transport system ATP-binding protein
MNRFLVDLRDVDVALGDRPILHGISWTLRPGQHWVVLGRNGSGKSTFLRLIRGELWPVPGQAARRVYQLDGAPQTSAVGVKESFALVSPEQQTRYLAQEWNLRADQVVASGIGGGDYVYEKLNEAQRRQVADAMSLLQVDSLARRNVQELSTGELRRVLIARALAARPRVIVCDEISDGLDASSRQVLVSALSDVACRGTQLLMATHRADEIPQSMTHRLVLEDGRVAEQGRWRAQRDRGHSERKLPGHSAAVTALSRTLPVVEQRSPWIRKRDRSAADDVLIRIRRADVYLGTVPTLRDIDLEIRRGQHWAVLGPNGSGKSTLLKLMAGDVHPARGGRVQRFAFTAKNTIWQVRARLGAISPELQANYRESLSGEEVVASGFFSSVGLLRKPGPRQRRRVRETLEALGLTSLGERNFLEMSYGEARRILLARALVKSPDLLLCDEPFDGLDVAARRQMGQALARAAALGATLVVVSHHPGDLPACTTHLARLREGRLEYCGAWERERERPAGRGVAQRRGVG